MKMVKVESSLIEEVGYSPDRLELLVKFKKGGVYVYSGVSQTRYESLINAVSVGSFFLKEIKPHFECRKPHTQSVAPQGIESQAKVGS